VLLGRDGMEVNHGFPLPILYPIKPTPIKKRMTYSLMSKEPHTDPRIDSNSFLIF
jgi:hypothetical protein